MFHRKAYDQLIEWKTNYSDCYAALLEGARRVGKSTIAEEFAKKEYDSYILVDFAQITKEMKAVFDDIANLDLFFLRLQALTGVSLKRGKSVIILDEIQLMPAARQAIKYLVKDGRYSYIETGSLISIKKNVKGIVIPSEEYRIPVFPMDYEEFLWATGKETYPLLQQISTQKIPIGNAVNRSLMRDFRLYMAVGGMPQAVEAYFNGKDFSGIDFVKREIIELYKSDFRKIDPSGRISAMYDAIPSQLALKKKRFLISNATGKRKSAKDAELLADLIDSKTVIPCYNVADPGIALAQSMDMDVFKLYLADIGLFTTLMFNHESQMHTDIYAKLLSDKLEADLGYMYENAVAQIIRANGRAVYYHTWTPEGASHAYEVDFLLTDKTKIIPIEVKSSAVNSHKSMDAFCEKYSHVISRRWLFSQKDIGHQGMLEFKPIYLAPILMK